MRSPEEIIYDLKAIEENFKEETGGCAPVCLSEAVEFIEQEQRPPAEWIRGKDDILNYEYWQCSRCGVRQPIQMSIKFARWCPFCRAPMKGES